MRTRNVSTRILARLAVVSALLALHFVTGVGNAQNAQGREIPGSAGVLDGQRLLTQETFWDNRDWDWYRAMIPMFECPDREIQTTYYYRWELMTKHLTYGDPNTGFVFTEFLDRPFWSGRYGAISCPAGHQLYEARWLRSPRIAHDYSRYWFRTPGAEPRRYSTWLADAVYAVNLVHPDGKKDKNNKAFLTDLLPDLVKNWEGWERTHFDAKEGLFWQTGHDDGMEYNITSRQTADILRGAPGFRPTINSYMVADAFAIAHIADAAGQAGLAERFRQRARAIRDRMNERLWDNERHFYFPRFLKEEHKDGNTVRAGSLTYETGKYAGSPFGREAIGYVPWQFGLAPADERRVIAWAKLTSPDGFAAKFGPTTVERRDPQFFLSPSCCWWSGQSWPYATAQTIKALGELLQTGPKQTIVSQKDYVNLLHTFAVTHRKNGLPYLAEAAHPDTGSFEGHDSYNHSEHYFHSGYIDLVLTGLVGLRPGPDNTLTIHPLAPADWDYFAADNVRYRNHNLTVLWDRLGARYPFGKGLHVLIDGKRVAGAESLQPVSAVMPDTADPAQDPVVPEADPHLANYAVNNEGAYYPLVIANGRGHGRLIDGNAWYLADPPNRWVSATPGGKSEEITLDLGTMRPLSLITLRFNDDGPKSKPPVRAPLDYALFYDAPEGRLPIPGQRREHPLPASHRAERIAFPTLNAQRIHIVLQKAPDSVVSLTELETWGPRPADGALVTPTPPPVGNLAAGATAGTKVKVTASFTSRFDRAEEVNDGRIVYTPTPRNRWTAYESPNAEDSLRFDFGAPITFRHVELALFDDGGGVQAPQRYTLEIREGDGENAPWRPIPNVTKTPEKPTGGMRNLITFDPVTARSLRITFTHRPGSKSGVTEVLVWEK